MKAIAVTPRIGDVPSDERHPARVEQSGNTPLDGYMHRLLVATYITVEAPISGMSMNPARTFASALPAHYWTALWLYFTAPVIGMLSAAELYVRTRGIQTIGCAKLHHDNARRCIFCGKPASHVMT